jgi:hypothetical protein
MSKVKIIKVFLMKKTVELGVVAGYTSSQEAESGRLRISGQTRCHSKILSQKRP